MNISSAKRLLVVVSLVFLTLLNLKVLVFGWPPRCESEGSPYCYDFVKENFCDPICEGQELSVCISVWFVQGECNTICDQVFGWQCESGYWEPWEECIAVDFDCPMK